MTYLLSWKRVKRLNLRITPEGEIRVSVPRHISAQQADRFVEERAEWIEKHRHLPEEPLLPAPEPERCREELSRSLARVYPLVRDLGVAFPELKVRTLKSQWGNCHWQQGYVTLNRALCRCPEELRDYVALHELVHFLHPNHGEQFYQCMDRLMPDWKQRRTRLRSFQGALSSCAI